MRKGKRLTPFGAEARSIGMNKLIRFFALLVMTSSLIAGDAKPVTGIALKDINGKDTTLKAYEGKVQLVGVVNEPKGCTSVLPMSARSPSPTNDQM